MATATRTLSPITAKELIALQEFVTIPTYLIKELPQDKLYALIDILSMADESGEIFVTQRTLMERWKWGNTKVRNFIDYLVDKDICKPKTNHETNQKQARVFIVNTEFLALPQTKNKPRNKLKTNHETGADDKEIYKRIIEYLNMVCGTRYKHTTCGNVKDLKSRLKEEYTEQDFYTVIDKKAKEWKGTERARYLRPSTLFGNKFGEYLNQKIVEDKPKNKFNDFPQREYDFDELEKQLLNR